VRDLGLESGQAVQHEPGRHQLVGKLKQPVQLT
jgi:hypothetical protein